MTPAALRMTHRKSRCVPLISGPSIGWKGSDVCHGSGAPWPTREVLMPSSFAAMILGLLAMIKCSINSWEHRQWKSCSGTIDIAWSGESQQGVVFSFSNSMSCGNLSTSSREDNASVLENISNRDENSMRAADVADLYNFMAMYMEFGSTN